MTAIKPQQKPEWPAIQQKGQSLPGDLPVPLPWTGVEDAMGGATNSRKVWARETKGASPPRDGPWALAAANLANLLPARARNLKP